MIDVNKMEIKCDPYNKEIKYYWFSSNDGKYIEPDDDSNLSSDEFIHTTIQNRAYEIIDIINRAYNTGNVGLEINFVGDTEDYNDFCDVVKTHYGNANIKCIRDKFYYDSAKDVMPKIENVYAKIKGILETTTEVSIKEYIDKYKDVVKPSISLCMIGLYSVGKSSFINSIIGKEILPSKLKATTATICKICNSAKYEIIFQYESQKCSLSFEGTKYKPNANCNNKIIKALQDISSVNADHDEVFHMNHALDILNSEEYAQKIKDIIEIHVPFNDTSLPIDKYDFVIYDTPGSNSASNQRHFEVLKKSLDKQTNALPILLITPDQLDAEDNNKLLNLIKKTGTTIDITNTIVVVNKSDTYDYFDLKTTRDNFQDFSITKWKSTRIFFVSSLFAMASKKSNPDNPDEWLLESSFRQYNKNKSDYYTDVCKLFELNVLDKSKSEKNICYLKSSGSYHLYKNSGLEAVEKEIIEYAEKYALRNKCRNASEYLKKAIENCRNSIETNKAKLNDELKITSTRFDQKKRSLFKSLNEKKDSLSKYNKDYSEIMQNEYKKYAEKNNLKTNDQKSKDIFAKNLKNSWDEIKREEKKRNIKGFAINRIQPYVEETINIHLRNFSNVFNERSVPFWREKSNQFKNDCIKIIHGSDALTDEQKRTLETVTLNDQGMPLHRMNFNLRNIGAIHQTRFLFWNFGETFDPVLCSAHLIKEFNDEVRTRITTVENTNERSFNAWAGRLITKLNIEIIKFNSDLTTYMEKIDKIQYTIRSQEACLQVLNDNKNLIDNLLMFKEAT